VHQATYPSLGRWATERIEQVVRAVDGIEDKEEVTEVRLAA